METSHFLNSSVGQERFVTPKLHSIHKVPNEVASADLIFLKAQVVSSIGIGQYGGGEDVISQGDIKLADRTGKKSVLEERWQRFFSDPSQWWDYREGKTNAKFPDFKHKETGEGLWIYDNSNPKWIKPKLRSIAPGAVPLPTTFWNKMMTKHVKEGRNQEAVELFKQMQNEGRQLDTFSFVPALKACGRLGALETGRQIHACTARQGCDSELFVGTGLLDMYAKCGCLEDAQAVFDKMVSKDVVSWTALIVGYTKCGQPQRALELYEGMKLEGTTPVSATYVGVLNACAMLKDLKQGRLIHKEIAKSGSEAHSFIGSTLVDMYAKCGNMDDAQNIFNRMSERSVVSWTALITGYAKCGKGRRALDVFEMMKKEQLKPAPMTLVGVAMACARVRSLEKARALHQLVIESGFDSNVFVGTSVIDMYACCGSTEDAFRVFEDLATKNVASWNALLTGYVKWKQDKDALEMFARMQKEGVEPNPTTFVVVINACRNLRLLDEGRRIHEKIVDRNLELSSFVGSSLVDMYSKCRSIEDACRAFNAISNRDEAAWTAMMMGFVNCGLGHKALALYFQMQQEGLQPPPNTGIEVLRVFAEESALGRGEDVKLELLRI